MQRRFLTALTLCGCALAAAPAHAQRVGVFFDEQATVCSAPILPIQSVHVWVYAFPPPDSVVSGVALRMLLPPSMRIAAGSVQLSRNPAVRSTEGDFVSGITIRYDRCITGTSPLFVAEMDLDDGAFFMRNDLRVTLAGVATDSVAVNVPEILICDPGDPLGAELGRMQAPSIDATFNCTTNCYCTTALRPRSWSEMKFLYRGH